ERCFGGAHPQRSRSPGRCPHRRRGRLRSASSAPRRVVFGPTFRSRIASPSCPGTLRELNRAMGQGATTLPLNSIVRAVRCRWRHHPATPITQRRRGTGRPLRVDNRSPSARPPSHAVRRAPGEASRTHSSHVYPLPNSAKAVPLLILGHVRRVDLPDIPFAEAPKLLAKNAAWLEAVVLWRLDQKHGNLGFAHRPDEARLQE